MLRQRIIEDLKAKSLETKKPQRLETLDEFFLYVDGKLVAYQRKIYVDPRGSLEGT